MTLRSCHSLFMATCRVQGKPTWLRSNAATLKPASMHASPHRSASKNLEILCIGFEACFAPLTSLLEMGVTQQGRRVALELLTDTLPSRQKERRQTSRRHDLKPIQD